VELAGVPSRDELITRNTDNAPRFLIEHGDAKFGIKHCRQIELVLLRFESHGNTESLKNPSWPVVATMVPIGA
jgi:hypothetical protein